MRTPTVEQRPISPGYSNVQANPDSFGAGLAQSVVAASKQVGDIAADINLKNDRQKALYASDTAERLLNEEMAKISQRKLTEAEGATAYATVEFEKIKAGAVKSATSERQARLIDEALTHKITALLGTTRNHEDQQAQATVIQQSEAMLVTAAESVRLDPMNEATAWVAKFNAAVAIKNREPGLPADALRVKQAEAVSAVTASQLGVLLADGKSADFLVLYPQVKGELVGKDADDYAKYATATADIVVEQKLAGDFYNGSKGDEAAALESVRSVLSGKQEEQVLSGVKLLFEESRRIQRDAQIADIDLGKAAFRKGGYKVGAIPVDVRTRLETHSPDIMISLDGLEAQRVAGTRSSIQTDPVSFRNWHFLTDAEKQLPENDPLKFASTWNETDYQKAVVQVADLKAKEGGFTKQTKGWTDTELSRSLTDTFLEVYKDKSDRNAVRYQKFVGAVNESIKNYQDLNEGSYPSYEKIQETMAYHLINGKVGESTGIWSSTKRRFLAEPGEKFTPLDANAPTSDPLDEINIVPTLDAAQIAKMLRDRGKPVTKEAILARYKMLRDEQRAKAGGAE